MLTTGVASVRGVDLAYEWGGAGSDVVWGHGLTSSMAAEDTQQLIRWADIRDGHRVLRYDARGHGESGSTPVADEYAWSELARDQLALADALGIDSYVAAGASMGCGTALHAAVQQPERIRALVLVIPPTGWENRAGQADLYRLMAATVETEGVEPLVAAGAEIPPPDPFVDLPELADARAEAMRAWDPTRLAQVFRGATTAQLPDRQEIAALSMPALVLAWTGDDVHPVVTAEELGRLMPAAEVHITSDLGGVLGWSDRVAAFLAALD